MTEIPGSPGRARTVYGTLEAGDSFTLLIRGTVDPGLERGYVIRNTAVVSTTTTDPDPDNDRATDETTVTVPHPNLSVTKVALDTIYSAVGDQVRYRISVINTSDVNLYNIYVTEPNAVITSGNPIARLTPWEQADVFATHVITQEDIDAGKVLNAVRVTGTNVIGVEVADSSNTVITSGLQRPQITATKYSQDATFRKVGDIIQYTIEVFNCGNVTVRNIETIDPNAVITSGNPIASLAPRQTVTVNAEHVVTQADLDAGKIVNIARIEGIDPNGKPVRDDSNELVLYANQAPRLEVTKYARESSFDAIGDTLHYDIIVANYRGTEMSNITVTDPNAVITGQSTIYKLASGKTALVRAYHIVNQQDLDAGKVVNIASARGKDYYDFIDQATSNEVTVFARQQPSVVVIKTAEESSFRNAGDLIHYVNEIRNTGNVRITGITLTDPNTAVTGSSQVAGLDPGQSVTIRTVHTVSQADLNIGFVEKTAMLQGLDANSQPIRVSSNTVIVQAVLMAGLNVTLTAAEPSFSAEGEIIHYSLEVRNTGNITLTNLVVSDQNSSLVSGSTIADLLPGSKAILTAEHLVTLDDMAAGRIVNMAVVTGYKPDGKPVTGSSNEHVILSGMAPGVTVTAVALATSYRTAGEMISYELTVRNSGNVAVTSVTVGAVNALISGNPVITALPANGSVTLTALHTVSQADIDAGEFTSSASVSGRYPDGTAYNRQSNDVTLYALTEPGLTARITAEERTFRSSGDQIHYTIEVKNTGNLTVSDITMPGSDLDITGSPVIRLLPGEKALLTGIYTVTPADIENGKVVRSVQAYGKDPRSQAVAALSNEVTVAALQLPELSAEARALQSTYSQVGEVIRYNITVTNTGNVSIISTAVRDTNAFIVSARPNVILMPGESFEATAAHIVTQEDIDAGQIVTLSIAAGFDLNGNTIEKSAQWITVYAIQRSELEVTSSSGTSLFRKVGEVIEYSIRVKNFGNISVFNTLVSDSIAIMADNQPVGKLQPGESAFLTAYHTVTQADLDAGEIVSISKAAGSDLNGKPVGKSGNRLVIKGDQRQELVTSTRTSVSTYRNEGDLIEYTVVVRNTGNVTMRNITVTDAKVMLYFNAAIASLAPGETDSLKAVHRITLDDINAGKIITAGIAHGYLNTREYSYMGNDVTVKMLIDNYNLSNFPNPFNYETTIVFDLPEKGEVFLKVYDMTGREIGHIDPKEYNEGRNYVTWRTLDTPKGLYVVRLYYNGNQATRMMMIAE
jgi:uncharacterized repeat protein (TIGR01451 family)